MEAYMWIVWLSLFILSVVIEALTTELVSFWFAGGALVSLILSFIPGVPFWIEIIVFTLVSALLLFALRPLVKKFLSKSSPKSNVEGMIHRVSTLEEDLSFLKPSKIYIGDVLWDVITERKDLFLEKGKLVEVVGVSGNKLIVEPYALPKEEK